MRILICVLLLVSCIFLENCTTTKTASNILELKITGSGFRRTYTDLTLYDSTGNRVKNPKVADDPVDFIEYADGRIEKKDLNSTLLKYKSGSRSKIVFNKKEVHSFAEIKSYQSGGERVYNCDDKYFGRLFKQGKINTYQHVDVNVHISERTMTRENTFLYYIQKGNEVITKLKASVLREMVADNPKAVEFVDRYIRADIKKHKYLEMAIDTYNGVEYNEEDY